MYSISIPHAFVALVVLPELKHKTENTRDNMLWQWQWWWRQRWRVMWYGCYFVHTRTIVGLGHLFLVFRWWFLFISIFLFFVFSSRRAFLCDDARLLGWLTGWHFSCEYNQARTLLLPPPVSAAYKFCTTLDPASLCWRIFIWTRAWCRCCFV